MRPNNMFKQKRIKYLGELVDSIFTAMPALSAFSIVSTTIILYEITKQYILNIFPWMNIIYFIVALVIIFMPILLVVFKWVIPSVWHFRSTQMSHLETQINKTTEELEKVNETLRKLLREKDENSSNK